MEEDSADLSDLDLEVTSFTASTQSCHHLMRAAATNTFLNTSNTNTSTFPQVASEVSNLAGTRRRVMSDPGAGKNEAGASSSLLPEGLPSFEEVTRSMQVINNSTMMPTSLRDYASKSR